MLIVTRVQTARESARQLLQTPVTLAALHQSGAVALLLSAVWLAHEFRSGGG